MFLNGTSFRVQLLIFLSYQKANREIVAFTVVLPFPFFLSFFLPNILLHSSIPVPKLPFLQLHCMEDSGIQLRSRAETSQQQSSTMPMEQVFKHYNKDNLKMAMLNHEETFKQQVHELHRLYRIQKLLMRDLKRELKRQRNLSTSPNGSTEYNRSALDVCSYAQYYGAIRGSHAATAPYTALSLDVAPAMGYAQSAEEDAEETDDEMELDLTLAVGSGGAAPKKRYNREHSPGESFSSSSTESDVLTGGPKWQAGVGSPYHKRRPAGFDVVQVEADGGVQQPPLLFHWLSLRMA